MYRVRNGSRYVYAVNAWEGDDTNGGPRTTSARFDIIRGSIASGT